jgi:alkanesulfonate monooxygenase SsuD/methylene tetrahydromethanopterin reductase-like flavin-dependent oxidoreductase (luciferase family)
MEATPNMPLTCGEPDGWDPSRWPVTAAVERRTRRLGFVTATATIGERLVARSQITKSAIAIR